MSLYRVGRIWHYDFEYRGARHKRSSGETSKMRAREVESARRRELRMGRLEPVDVAFGDLTEKYIKTHASTRRSKTFYEYVVRVVLKRHFDEDRMLSTIGPAERRCVQGSTSLGGWVTGDCESVLRRLEAHAQARRAVEPRPEERRGGSQA